MRVLEGRARFSKVGDPADLLWRGRLGREGTLRIPHRRRKERGLEMRRVLNPLLTGREMRTGLPATLVVPTWKPREAVIAPIRIRIRIVCWWMRL